MKAELTLENKVKFFAQYYGQEIMKSYGKTKINTYKVGYLEESREEEWLELKPIELLTDYEAAELAEQCEINIGSHDLDLFQTLGQFKESIEVSGCDSIAYFSDYLRFKGYAVDWMGISVEEMVQAGWIKFHKSFKIRCYPQEMDRLNIKGDPGHLLKELGFKIIDWEYEGFVPVHLIELEASSLELPEWAEKY